MNIITEYSKRKPPCGACARKGRICPFCELVARNLFAAGLPRFVRREHGEPARDWSWKPTREARL